MDKKDLKRILDKELHEAERRKAQEQLILERLIHEGKVKKDEGIRLLEQIRAEAREAKERERAKIQKIDRDL